MRSGNISPTNSLGVFRFAGQSGQYWSLRASAADSDGNTYPSAYDLVFSVDVYPSRGPHTQYLGFPLRCLSTVIDI